MQKQESHDFRRGSVNPSIQEQIDEQVEDTETQQTENLRDIPLLTHAALAEESRPSDCVEVDVNAGTARVVETSDAPELTRDIILEKYQAVQHAKITYNLQNWEVGVRHGKPLAVEIQHAKILARYEKSIETANENDQKRLTAQRDDEIKRYLLSQMIAEPVFSYQGIPKDGFPLEDASSVLIDVLWEAYLKRNHPLTDNIYQVKVRRSTPLDAALMLQETFQIYPLEPSDIPILEMNESDLRTLIERNLAQKQILVGSMILEPRFTKDVEVEQEHIPIHAISDGLLNVLHQAYRVVNLPEEGLKSLERFQELESNRARGNSGI